MEPIGTIFAAVFLGSVLVLLERKHVEALERKRARVTAPAPAPEPVPTPPTPGPAPTPPSPSPEVFVEIPSTAWKEKCWWDDSPADAYLDPNENYIVTWPVAWAGEQPVNYYLEPSDLADVEPTAYWVGDNVFVDIVIRPKRKGWATLMMTEGKSGAQAVKGEVPWRAQCMKIEVQ